MDHDPPENDGAPPPTVEGEVAVRLSDLFGEKGGSGEIGRRLATYDLDGGMSRHSFFALVGS